MMRALAFILFFTVSTFCQSIPFPGPGGTALLGTGTFTFVQDGHCHAAAATSCTITMSVGALAAGNLYTVMSQSGTGYEPVSSVVSGADTYTKDSTLITALSCSASAGAAVSLLPMCQYVLPSAALGNSQTVTINFASAITSSIYVQEWHPSANAANVALDSDGGFVQTAASTSSLGPTFTASGTGNVTMQHVLVFGSSAPTAVTAPYSTNEYLPYGAAGAVSVAQPTWTITSAASATQQMSFSWNPAPFSEELFQGFEGVSGNTPTPATLQAEVTGWNGCQWGLAGTGGTFVYSTAANMPLANSTGRMADGTSVSAAQGTLGLASTYDGSTVGQGVLCKFGGASGIPDPVLTKVTLGMWFYGDQPAAGAANDNVDGATIHGSTDFAAFNYYATGGSRFVGLETPEGNGSHANVPASTWLWVLITYQAGGTHNVSVYDCSSGSPPTCPLQLVVSSSHAAAATPDYPYYFQILGGLSADDPDSGTHNYFDSVKFSLTGATLMP